SGDSTTILPPYGLPRPIVRRIKEAAQRLAKRLNVNGLMNVQLAIKDDPDAGRQIYILEVNPRASRTVPYVSKANGVPWARLAARVMMGATLKDLDVREVDNPGHFSVKEPVFPFAKFPGVDVVL